MSGFGLAHAKWVFYVQVEDPLPCHLDRFLTRLFYGSHFEESGFGGFTLKTQCRDFSCVQKVASLMSM